MRRLVILMWLGFASSASLLTWASSIKPHQGTITVCSGKVLRSGSMVTLTWGMLPSGTEEFELLLRCELPASLTIRLTESKDPRVSGLLWRVPNIPCLKARILLRRGTEEREVIWGRSEPFEIRFDRATPPDEVAIFKGDLWLRRGSLPRKRVFATSQDWTDRLPCPSLCGGTTSRGVGPRESWVSSREEACVAACECAPQKAIGLAPNPLKIQLRI